jgi:hypothetical protein
VITEGAEKLKCPKGNALQVRASTTNPPQILDSPSWYKRAKNTTCYRQLTKFFSMDRKRRILIERFLIASRKRACESRWERQELAIAIFVVMSQVAQATITYLGECTAFDVKLSQFNVWI